MTRLTAHLRAITTIFFLHLKQMAVDGFVIVIVVAQPLIVAFLAIFMLRDSPGFHAMYVIVGSALTGLWSGTLFFSAVNIQAERWTGTLETIIGSPTSLVTVMVGKSLANVVLSLSSMLISYPIAALLFGYPLTIAAPLLFVISLLLTILALMSLGMLIAPIMALRPGADVWANALEFPVYMLSGFLFSTALLPAWTTPLSYILAPYWAARALHATSSGTLPLTEVFVDWGLLLLSSGVYWIIALWLLRIMLWRAREEATLSLQ